MTTAQRPSKLLGKSSSPLALRIVGSERDGQIIHIHAPRCLVGADPNCQLRLVAADVQPQHCVIYQGKQGTILKSWTRDTRINGTTADEQWIRHGDHLSIGSINFEVLAEQTTEATPPASEDLIRAKRASRVKSHRRVRGLLDTLRRQKTNFSSVQNRLEETQSLVDNLLANQTVADFKDDQLEQQIRETRQQQRATGNRRIRGLINHLRHQNQTTQEQTNALLEAKDAIVELRQYAKTLESQQIELKKQKKAIRALAKQRVKALVSNLRTVQSGLEAAGASTENQSELQDRIQELETIHAEITQELQSVREARKSAESELAWSQQEVGDLKLQTEDLQNQIRIMESQVSKSEDAATSEDQTDGATVILDGVQAEDQQELIAELKSELFEASQTNETLQNHLNQLSEERETLESEIAHLSQCEQSYKEKLQQAQEQTQSLRLQLEASSAPSPLNLPETSEPSDEEDFDAMRSTNVLSHLVEQEEPAYEDVDEDFQPAEISPSLEEDKEELEEEFEEETPVDAEPPSGFTNDEEITVDDYMKNLLARMRTKRGEEPEPPAPKPVAKPKAKQSGKSTEESPRETTSEVPDQLSTQEYQPSRFAPEQTCDIRKLRELANETAKAAIDSATISRWERLCTSKLYVSIASLLAGFALHYMSTNYLSVTFLTACMAYVITVFWWLQSAVIFNHVKTHRKEKFAKRMQEELFTAPGQKQPEPNTTPAIEPTE